MNQSSIYQKPWLDLVFEGKNKHYGAYVLRQENGKTTIKAFIVTLLSIACSIIIVMLFSAFTPKSPETPIIVKSDETITIVDLDPISPKKEAENPKTNKQNSSAPEKPKNNLPFVVAPTSQINPEIIPEVTGVTISSDTTTSGTGMGNDNENSGNGTISTTGTNIGTDTPEVFVDSKAKFPGGINKFYEYIGKNFDKKITDESGKALSVLMYFIIEKDGTMSNIKVIRESRKDVGEEAMRILKNNTTKWKPALKNGKTVRTVFTIPITIQTRHND